MENSKVLVIDDDPMTCNLLETILQMENFQTESVNHIDAQGIVPILDGKQPDLVIMDYHLGPVESLKYTKAIRASEKWQNLPVIMTSAIDRRQQALDAGATDFILKPFNWEELTQHINTLKNNADQEVPPQNSHKF